LAQAILAQDSSPHIKLQLQVAWEAALSRPKGILFLCILVFLLFLLCPFLHPPPIPEPMAEAGQCEPLKLPEYCTLGMRDGEVPPGMCLVERFLVEAASPARELLLNRVALTVGFLLILQFHLMPLVMHLSKQGRYESPQAIHAIKASLGRNGQCMFLRSVGRNIVVLNIYYSTALGGVLHKLEGAFTIQSRQPFAESIIFTFFESVILFHLGNWLQRKYDQITDLNKEREGEEIAISKFSDFSVTWGTATITWMAQVSLFLLFTLDLNGDTKSHDECSMNIFYWFAAVLVTNVAGQDECGGSFRRAVWKDTKSWNGVETEQPVRFWTRYLYDFTINCFCREVLLCIAPVALSTSDRNELIKDCLAIFFITKLDDIDDPMSIVKCLTKRDEEEEDDRIGGKEVDETEGQNDMEKQLLEDSPAKAGIQDRLEKLEKQLKLLGGKIERRCVAQAGA